jgi:dTDP-4-dehydrorhamnose 3,5-epimerase
MRFQCLEIPEVMLIKPEVFGDHRGFFMETWREDSFRKNVSDISFVQDNHSKSGQGVLRGLHYQIKQAQGKLVRVLEGKIFDVAIDLRKSSPAFGKWVSAVLSDENKHMLWIPPGFAHGFYVMSDTAQFAYKCSDYYAPEHERCIRWNDPDLKIKWPVPAGCTPVLSDKDEKAPLFSEAEVYP